MWAEAQEAPAEIREAALLVGKVASVFCSDVVEQVLKGPKALTGHRDFCLVPAQRVTHQKERIRFEVRWNLFSFRYDLHRGVLSLGDLCEHKNESDASSNDNAGFLHRISQRRDEVCCNAGRRAAC